jgi:hypothetical protein
MCSSKKRNGFYCHAPRLAVLIAQRKKPLMRNAVVLACLLSLPLAGCAAKQRKTCCLIAGGVGLAALFGLAGGAIDDVVDPEPTHSDTGEGQRKHWEWQQRQIENSQPSF